jgi:hypothetical protein
MGGSDNGDAHASIDMSTDTWEQDFSDFSASKSESFFNEVLASLPRTPSADTTKGENASVV